VAAREALYKRLGAQAAALDVEAGADGKVTLHGQVASMEDRLLASRCLRDLPGCVSVVNEMTVRPVTRDGHTLTLVTRDGTQAVHGSVSASASRRDQGEMDEDRDPPRRVSSSRLVERDLDEDLAPPPLRVVPAAPRPQVVLPPAPAPTVPSGLPPARDVYVRLRSATQVHPVVYVAPTTEGTALPAQATPYAQVTGYPGVATPAAQPAPQERRLLLREWLANLFFPTPRVVPQVAAPAAAPPRPAVTYAQVAPTPPPMPAAPSAVVAEAQITWPPAHHVIPGPRPGETTANLTSPRPALSASPAIRLAARPELAPPAPPVPPSPVQSLIRATPSRTAALPPPRLAPVPATTVAKAAQLPPVPASVTTPPAPAPKPAVVTPAAATQAKPTPPPVVPVPFVPTTTRPTAPAPVTPTAAQVSATAAVRIPTSPSPTTGASSPPAPRATPAPRAAPAVVPADRLPPNQLRALVVKAVDKLARQVRVEVGADKRPTVHIDAAPPAEKELIRRMLQVPEIAASKLRVQIHLAP
jgi:hypothetical protein